MCNPPVPLPTFPEKTPRCRSRETTDMHSIEMDLNILFGIRSICLDEFVVLDELT
jgi:hypothetical protein